MKRSPNPLVQMVKPSLKALLQRSGEPEVNPTGDLQGFLESPNAIERNVSGVLRIAGWLFHQKSAIASLILIQGNGAAEIMTYGELRPDVAEAFPDVPHAEKSGFGWNLPIEPNFSGQISIKIVARLENSGNNGHSSTLTCFTRQITIQNVYERPPKVKLSQRISGFMTKLILAYKQRGSIPLSPLVWVRFIKRYYDQTKTEPFTAYSGTIHPWQQQDPYQRWLETNRLTSKLRQLMEDSAAQLAETGVKISVVVPIYNPPKEFLQETIASVRSQIYPNWELCLADDASTEPYVKEILEAAQAADSRIKVVFRSENGHIVKATNSALEVATGEFIALLDHDDLLSPDALLHVAECIAKYPETDWVYTDEDKVTPTGERYGYQMKGVWSPEMAIAHNYTHHLAIIRKTLVDEVKELRPGLEGAQDIDLYLRVREKTTVDRVRHIPKVCYHWRVHAQSTASKGTQKTYVFDSAYRAISDALERRNLRAKPFLTELGEKYGLCLHQLQWDSSILAENPVTIVIPNRDRIEMLAQCITSLEKTVDSRYVSVIIVDDDSTEAETEQFWQHLENPSSVHQFTSLLPEKLQLSYRVIRTKRPDPSLSGREGFNYSRLVNLGAEQVKTPLMLQLNNDITAISPGWLEDMVGWLSIEGVGVVGARLLYPDNTLQHAGVCVGTNGGLAGHLFHGVSKDEIGYIFYPHITRNVSAVTGACLLTPTELYREVNGFDQEKLGLELNDVDYCLRVGSTGKRIVYTPQATLIHQGSASRGDYYNPKEHLNFMAKYPEICDRYINPSINIDSMVMDLDPLHYIHTDRISGIKILLVTHNLALEGAPLMAYHFAKHFVESGECQVSVVSLVDGPLRKDYEALNISVKLIEDNLQRVDGNLAAYRDRLQAVGELLKITNFDLILSNTMVGFWGVELAQLFNLPSIWNIHESCPIDRSLRNFFGDSPPQAMRQVLERCFQNASRVIFVADATRKIFHDLDIHGRFRTIPGGMNLKTIQQFRQTHSKSALRQKYGIAEDKTVISIIGTTCERKGQHIFLEAIKHLEKIYPAQKFQNLEFLIVGTREIIYLDYLRQVQQRLKLDYVKMYPETRQVFDFFGLTDIFVCASFEESFPRVILEAMAFELKIVSTNVFGIPEMIGDRHEGYLVRPGDPEALGNALVEAIDTDYANRLRGNAYARVNRLFDNQKQLPKHLQIVKEAILQQEPTSNA
ncbi:glycosyltransferase [Roseofilum casamattae]|uniref:Glycosyltransferase n=1 Tax=Roseofilum casamattae BLCC-M143 TaxID=3022442 RepID=A0ABT7C006_9CYAN|nr:glycosyltransferase [Roseofilum casamattae]MDJ1184787.1 glycosyltransferase [Roseofilum casamattae BLCC-M143]